jgi:hypothetical protein
VQCGKEILRQLNFSTQNSTSSSANSSGSVLVAAMDYKSIAEQIFLATDTAKLMREMGLTSPASTSKTFVVMGKTFDPSKPDDYVNSFSIRRS